MMMGVALGLAVAMALVLVRLLAGPTLYDRVLAVNAFGTKTVLFLAVFAFLVDRPDAIDIALVYALINFTATIAILKFFRYRAFSLAIADDPRSSGPIGPGAASNAPASGQDATP
jgi:multicomponent Na+:H+ antiporter subunit F